MTSSHSQTLVNLYGKGIDEPSEWGHREIDGQAREGNGRDEWERTIQILMRYDPTLIQGPQTFYYQHDHEGSVTHLTDGSGNVIEKYRYDVFGTPTIYDAANPPHVRTASIVSNRFLFTGREWSANFGFYEYRARAYHPGLGRFMSEDPKLFDAGDYNLFRYCRNDPIDFTDPTGTYGEGAGWSPNRWKTFDEAQKAAAQRLQAAVNRIGEALKAGKDSKEFKSLSKDFQKVFHTGATTENLSKVSQAANKMITALRDDGSKGYVANVMTKANLVRYAGGRNDVLGLGAVNGKTIDINVNHPDFHNAYALSWQVGHESGHNFGLIDAKANGAFGYKYSSRPAEQRAYQNLSSGDALRNADSYMDFVMPPY